VARDPRLAPFAFPRLGRYSELDDLLDGQVSTQPSASASFQPFCLKSLRRLARSTCSGDHVPLLLTPFSLPSLPHSLHLQTFPHQDSTYEGPFAFAHPVRIQGYPEFPAHALSFMVVRA